MGTIRMWAGDCGGFEQDLEQETGRVWAGDCASFGQDLVWGLLGCVPGTAVASDRASHGYWEGVGRGLWELRTRTRMGTIRMCAGDCGGFGQGLARRLGGCGLGTAVASDTNSYGDY